VQALLAKAGQDRYVRVCPAKESQMDTSKYKPDPLEFRAEATLPDLRNETVEALMKGFRGYCPACGKGRMFRAYLKVADNCPACGEELHHHRADDFPAYLVIVITGHILVPIVLAVETIFAPSMWLSIPLWLTVAASVSAGLLQPIKGAVVALQWQLGMHGFEESRKMTELEPTVILPSS
jgi:uncharacterized protein (DUF983 family)